MDNPLPEREGNENQDLPDADEDDPGIPEAEEALFGVNAVSPLINLPYFVDGNARTPSFDMVDGFIVDPMHVVDLGISKFFLTRWLEDYGFEYYIKPFSGELDNRIKAMKPPLEFRRMPRDLSERARFNAREYSNWTMFMSLPVLSGILPDKYLKVWTYLIQALFLVNQEEVGNNHLKVADDLIVHFSVRTQEYYGEAEITFNLHILKHLTEHIQRHGPAWASSAYCFEDGNGKFKQIIHSNLGIPHQVVRALSWKEASNILKQVVSQKAKDYVLKINQPQQHQQVSFKVGCCRLIGKPLQFTLSPEEVYQCEQFNHAEANMERYYKVICLNCCYTDNSRAYTTTNNSVAQLQDKTIVLIRRIFYDRVQDEIFLLVFVVKCAALLVFPEGIRLHKSDHFMQRITSINEEIFYIKPSGLKIVCFRASLPHGDFVAPFPNVHNRH